MEPDQKANEAASLTRATTVSTCLPTGRASNPAEMLSFKTGLNRGGSAVPQSEEPQGKARTEKPTPEERTAVPRKAGSLVRRWAARISSTSRRHSMYGFTREDIDLEKIRSRLARMRDDDLLAYGKAAAFLAKRSNDESWKVQLREARPEWRRRISLSGFIRSRRSPVRCAEQGPASLASPLTVHRRAGIAAIAAERRSRERPRSHHCKCL